MKDLFMCLLVNVIKHGNLTSAVMYDDTMSSLKLDDGKSIYEITIIRKKKELDNE